MTDIGDSLEERVRQRETMARNPLETIPVTNKPNGNIPNTPLAASTISFCLGVVFSLSASTFISGGFSSPSILTFHLGFFLAAWALFHWLEFAVTAGWNIEKCSVDSFLLDNGAMYHIANSIAVLEYLVVTVLKPSAKTYPYVSQIGMFLVIFGQILRSLAMIHASTNFSHSVAFYKRENHQLVTTGIYAWFRHPSYAGFFYWAIGTQLVLQNPLSFVLFATLLWRFFYYRTRAEENALIKFFGADYVKYRETVRVWIPFVP